jgi:Ser/Thr protein kinase RdoA (MazF antagonist)
MTDTKPKDPIEQAAAACLADHYGIEGRLARLPGENLNFRVEQADGHRWVLKIVDQHMPSEVVAMESAALKHAAKAGLDLQLPQIIENKYGNIETGINIHIKGVWRARLIEFLNGKDLSSITDISDLLLQNVGKTLAIYNRAMRGFDHPAAHRVHRWNLVEALQHEGAVDHMLEPARRELLAWAFGGFRQIRPQLDRLPWQFIHGDAHDENLLVQGERISGLVDFGDAGYNPIACELAISLTYLMMRRPDPFEPARLVLDGYQQVSPLSDEELIVLYPLICARLAVTVTVSTGRRAIDPDNPNWFGGEPRYWAFLERLHALGPDAFAHGLLKTAL